MDMSDVISRQELQQSLGRRPRPVLLETLPANYFQQSHLPGAINIPHDSVDKLAARLLPDKDAEIVVYCASITCHNSDYAAGRLKALGYANVRIYADGKADWIEAGLPVESGDALRVAS
jgi:rhodanese-related sulfurtransferase